MDVIKEVEAEVLEVPFKFNLSFTKEEKEQKMQ